MHSPTFRIIGAILITLAVLVFLFKGFLHPVQQTPDVHSTLQTKP